MSENNTAQVEALSTDTTQDSTESVVENQENTTAEAVNKIAELESKPKLSKQEAKTIRQLKLKVDGKEFLEDLPFEIPNDSKSIEYATRQIQLAKASQSRMSQHAELQKQVTGFIEELKKNPKKILSDPNIGIDVKKFAAQILEEEIAASKKSPEQLEKEKLESRLKELEDERKKEKEEHQKQQFEMLQTQAYEEYDREISDAINSSTLPKSSYTVKKVADYMLMGLKDGIDVKAADVIPLVEEEIRKDLRDMFAVLPEDVIEQLVGKDTLGKLRKKNVAKAKQVVSNATKGIDVGQAKKEPEVPLKKMTIRQYLKV